ncbi:MAG: glycosyltransferase [Clostridium sp.]|uniref:glycosyltransferase family 2 protein n=1 Tax=Clostridium sp. TaxID=1506 RepID=UPI0039E8C622
MVIEGKENHKIIDVSIIIPCKNEGNNLISTVDSILNSKTDLSIEIIAVDDASNDLCVEKLELYMNKINFRNFTSIHINNKGPGMARNAGASKARGKYLFFCDGHIKIQEHCFDGLVNTLVNNNADFATTTVVDMYNSNSVGYGATWNEKLQFTWLVNKPHGNSEVPIASGTSLFVIKSAFEKIGGYNKLFKGYGLEDQEICMKAWLYGFKIFLNPKIQVTHLFRKKHPYKIKEFDFVYNTLCLGLCFFNKKRYSKLINIYKNYRSFSMSMDKIRDNIDKIFIQREKFLRECIYSDDYFFNKFNIHF